MNQTKEMETETLGERIRRFRKERGISQAKLAEMCGVTMSWISQLENGREDASPALLTKMASAFKIPIRELLLGEEEHMELICRIKLIEILLESNQPDEAESYIHSLIDHPDLSEKERMTLTVHLAECRYQQKRYEEVLGLLQPIIDKLEADNYHDAHMMAWIRNKIGNAYSQIQDTSNAYYNYKKALDYSTRFPTFDQLAAFINYNVGLTLRRKGRSSEALEYLRTASDYFKETSDLRSYAHSIFVQGVAFKTVKDYEKAYDLLTQTIKLYESLNHTSMCHAVQVTLASNIVSRDNPEKALENLQESLCFYRRQEDFSKIIFVLSKIISVYIEMGKLSDCHNLLHEAVDVISKLTSPLCHEVGDFYKTYARFYYESAELNHAIIYGLKSSEIYGNLGMISDQVDSLELVVNSYRDQRNFEKAFEYQTQRNELLQLLKGG